MAEDGTLGAGRSPPPNAQSLAVDAPTDTDDHEDATEDIADREGLLGSGTH